MGVDWAGLLGRLVAGTELDEVDAEAALAEVMAGRAAEAQVAGLLVALRAKGETPTEIAGLARAMRAAALRVQLPDHLGEAVDTCGTGGDGSGTFNVSTVAAVVLAACGVPVAKHGNRAASSSCGSADLLEALGVAVDLGPEQVAESIERAGIGFCFAQVFHPAMRHVMPARKALGIPTVFNLLGPLTNPAGVRRQVVGVADRDAAPVIAGVLARLDTRHALVVHGHDGLDELTTTGPSTVWEVRDGEIDRGEVDPADLGLPRARLADLQGGGVEGNLAIARAVLTGERGPARDMVLLNAAAGLLVAGRVAGLAEGLEVAAAAVDRGEASATLERWAQVSDELAGRATPDRG